MAEIPSPVTQALRVRDPQYREIYTNSSQTQLGPFDISILFQKNTEIMPGQPGQIDLVLVSMSPQHFKGFVKSITETLSAYETVFGSLTIPDENTAPLKSAAEIVKLIETAKAQAKSTISPSSFEPPQPSTQSRGASRKREPKP
jgi:Protein of unknown function (DUF3467)